MSLALDLTETQVLAALRAFLTDVLPVGVAVIRGQVNRVPEVTTTDFVVMTLTLRRRLSTNVVIEDAIALTEVIRGPTELTIQCDIHGPDATDNTQLVATMWRSDYACRFFAASGLAIAPLYAADGAQMPFINGEAQYEDRWVLPLVMQVNPVVSTTQQFADTLALQLVEVDTTYPPGAP